MINPGPRAALADCPFCGSADLHRFSHYTSCHDGMREIPKIMCAACQGEAPEKSWNVRARLPLPTPAVLSMSQREIADEIEQSGGLYCMGTEQGVSGHQLGIRKTAAVVVSLRSLPATLNGGADRDEMIRIFEAAHDKAMRDHPSEPFLARKAGIDAILALPRAVDGGAVLIRQALEFYADPFAWKKKHDPEDVLRIPDFYSETSFGDTALEALSALSPNTGDGK